MNFAAPIGSIPITFLYLPEDAYPIIFNKLNMVAFSCLAHSCKKFYLMAQSDKLPRRLIIPKIHPRITQSDALTLFRAIYTNKNTQFTLDSDCQLKEVGIINFLEKGKMWFQGDDGKLQVFQRIALILREITRLNKRGSLLKDFDEESSFKRIYVWNPAFIYSPNFPASSLAKVILRSDLAAVPEIKVAAEELLKQKKLYRKFPKRMPDIRVYVPECDIRDSSRNSRDDQGHDDQLYCNTYSTYQFIPVLSKVMK